MRPYLIVGHDYRRTSAGIRALHKLCHVINERGGEAYVLAAVVNDAWNTPQATPEIVDWVAEDGIVVYPEVESGNKLGGRRVVRYLLNRPGFIRDAWFGEDEVRFCYCGLLQQFVAGDEYVLTVPVVDAGAFRDRGMDRLVELFWVGKWSGRRILDEGELIEITLDWPARQETLVDLFCSAQMFYSYTDYTALTIEARLCGCPAAIIPSGYYSVGMYDTGLPGGTTGMAVGLSGDELRRAKDTVDGFRDRYLRDISTFDDQLDRFIEITQAMQAS